MVRQARARRRIGHARDHSLKNGNRPGLAVGRWPLIIGMVVSSFACPVPYNAEHLARVTQTPGAR